MNRVISRRALGVALGMGMLWAPAAASGALVTFDSSDDLSHFVENGGVTPTIYSWTDNAGIGTPVGSVTHSNGGNADSSRSLFYTTETFSTGDGPLTASIMLKADAGTGSGSSGSYSRNFVGFASGTGVNLATETGKLGVRILKQANTTNWNFQLQSGTSTLNLGSAFTLTDGNWYQMTVVITQTDTNKFDLAGELLDFGADGQTLNPGFSRSGSQEFTNATMGAASQWYAGLLGQTNDGGATNYDNLSVVPEPGSMLGLAMAGALLIRRRARRI